MSNTPATSQQESTQTQSIHDFTIAELNVRIIFRGNGKNAIDLLPSFKPFKADKPLNSVFFTFTVEDTLDCFAEEDLEPIGTFDTGNGDTTVHRHTDGGYQFHIRNIKGKACCLLQTNPDFSICRCMLMGSFNMRSYGLNNALILTYAFAGSFQNAVLVHASVVRRHGYGYAFIAKSGTGKSTQVSSWLRYIPDCDLMNDDTPVIRLINEQPYIYGSPWSGKTPCYRNIKAKLGAITRIARAEHNSIEKLPAVSALAVLLPAVSTMKWDKQVYNNAQRIMFKLIETTPHFILHCLPDKDAALLCHKTISQ